MWFTIYQLHFAPVLHNNDSVYICPKQLPIYVRFNHILVSTGNFQTGFKAETLTETYIFKRLTRANLKRVTSENNTVVFYARNMHLPRENQKFVFMISCGTQLLTVWVLAHTVHRMSHVNTVRFSEDLHRNAVLDHCTYAKIRYQLWATAPTDKVLFSRLFTKSSRTGESLAAGTSCTSRSLPPSERGKQ